jgi:hypothetical protein
MDNIQTNRLNSLIKSDDFLSDHVMALAPIAQIGPLAVQLNATIQAIFAASGAGDQDNSGVTEDKKIKRNALEAITILVARGAAAFFHSTNMIKELRIVDFTEYDLSRKRDDNLYTTAKALHQLVLPHQANLIGVSPAQVAQLDTNKEDFFDVIQDPKRETEISAVQNAQINPLIKEGMANRDTIDIYMQTIISTNAPLYDEWKMTLSIDDLGGGNTPPAIMQSVNIASGDTITVDYSAIILQGNSEIKLINNSAGVLKYGFGADPLSFVVSIVVLANSQQRHTCASLGYDSMNATFLNINNNEAVSQEAELEIYFMD